MEKLDRFYVPNISEFHVGFEYEIHTTTTGGLSFLNFKEDGSTEMTEVSKPTHKIWEKTKVLNPIPTGERHIIKDEVIWDLEYDSFFYHRPLKDIGELINSNQVRVKYLDKEDIESGEYEAEIKFFEEKD